jgi:hypothetical protein
MSIEKNLAVHAKQPGARSPTGAERQFIEDLRKAALCGVGYGWMQQVIEWEWQAHGPGAWGPYYFGNRISELEKLVASQADGGGVK